LFDVVSLCQAGREFQLELRRSVLPFDHVLNRKKHSFNRLSVSSRN
jgi:hypothetical protein